MMTGVMILRVRISRRQVMPSMKGIMMSRITRSTLSPRQGGQGGGAVAGLQAGEAGVLQMLADQVADTRFIVNNQDLSHNNPS